MNKIKRIEIIGVFLIVLILLVSCEFEFDDTSLLCDDQTGNCAYYSFGGSYNEGSSYTENSSYAESSSMNSVVQNPANIYTDYGKGNWMYHSKGYEELLKYYSNPLSFAEYVPEKAISSGDSLPLIIWLHGTDEAELTSNSNVNGFLSSGMLGVVNNWTLKNIPAIIIAPRSATESWKDQRCNLSIEAMIKYAIEKYNIDTNRIVLIGHSMGGSGVIRVAYKMQNYFSALVPLSAYVDSPFLTENAGATEYFSNIPMKGYTESGDNHERYMKRFFNATNHGDDLKVYDTSHANIPKKALTEDLNGDGISDIIYWALSQRKNN